MSTVFDLHFRLMKFFVRHGIDLRNLPALVPEAYRNDSARAVEAEVGVRISRLKDKIDAGAFEQETPSTGMPRPISLFGHHANRVIR